MKQLLTLLLIVILASPMALGHAGHVHVGDGSDEDILREDSPLIRALSVFSVIAVIILVIYVVKPGKS